ncbi:MAG TPA: putative sulfate exporter family transporter [Firmicutes bacterium]|nr:putative sulfate exporter family transporter [Bacillota bacterium]
MKNVLPGLLLATVIAMVATYVNQYVHVIGASVFALFIGMAIHFFMGEQSTLKPGITFSSKSLLKLAIILLGTSLSMSQIIEVGKFSLIVMVFTLAAAFGFGYLFGKLFKMDWKLSSLISAGTGICGGTAIATLSQVIDADDSHVAYAISATFIFDVLMVIAFPIMGAYLGLSDMAFGLWAGTAINDTSSVVAAGYTFSHAAGDFATIVKLTRTLSIIPIVLAFSYLNERLKMKQKIEASLEEQQPTKVNIKKIFPWFILMFLGAALLNSIGVIPASVSQALSQASKFFMVIALAAIGLKTNIKDVTKSGVAPMLHGFIISFIVVIISLAVQVFLGQV